VFNAIISKLKFKKTHKYTTKKKLFLKPHSTCSPKLSIVPSTSFHQFREKQDSAGPARAEFTLAHGLPVGKPTARAVWTEHGKN